MKKHILLALLTGLTTTVLFAQKKLTIEEAVTGQFRQYAPETIQQLSWMGKSDTYSFVRNDSVFFGKVKGKGITSLLTTLTDMKKWKGGEDLKSMPMIHWLSLETFSYDNGTAVFVGDLKSQTISKVCAYPSDAENQEYHEATKQMAFTRENNLFVLVNGVEKAITTNKTDIVSGQSISRNEYGITKGIFWSPDGSKLAFYQKDESNVTNYPLIDYKAVPAQVKNIKYPMAGGKSELVSVGVYDIASGKTTFLQLNNGKMDDQFYATNLTWGADNKTVYIAHLNRGTTDMKFISYDAATGKENKILFTEHDDRWVEPLFPAYFIPNHPEQFVWLSNRDGYTNAYVYSTVGASLGQTKLNFDITEFLGFDLTGENAYVMATGEIPTESLCYRISLKDMSTTKVTPSHGVHHTQISGSGQFVIDQFSNLTTPNKVDILSIDGRLVRNLLTAKNPYEGVAIGQTELFTIKAKDGSDLWCRIIKPSNFDPNKKYPVVVYVYGGPHAQMVTNSFLGGASLWMNKMAEDGYIIFTLDNHGSANRGKEFQQIIHKRLGVQELSDQLIGVDWLKKQSFVDAKRMAIHGWSFGGFMTTSMMLRYPDTFKVGVAGGPVIDWSMYEVMYGERYMDTPQENPDGYKEADCTNYIKNLKGDLLMIHGVDDDVVVMQHNMKFLKAAVDNKVQVDFFAYPGHAHNVRGKDRVHLITKIVEYIEEKLAE
ncbi:MAG: S9 family peptidase [Flavobacteriales bacterium]|nr:S9 family peptidase [Flavobacteriales bacterium]